MQNTNYDHTELAKVVGAFCNLKEVKENPYHLEEFQWKIDYWRNGSYKLVVVGEIKKGKSSFVNALLGNPNLAPVAARVASSVPIKIIYGEKEKFRVHFLLNDPENPNQKSEPLAINLEELEQYATETGTGQFSISNESGNKDNQLGVDYISIEYPNPFLKAGLVIVDLPGLGGVFKHHTRLVQEYLHPKRADHIVYVLDSTGNPLSKEEAKAIRTLKEKKMDRFLFVQTKIDAPSEEKVEKYKQENLRQISEILEKPAREIKYFTVSNTLKLDWLKSKDKDDLEDSNFPVLEQYLLDELIPEKRDRLAENFIPDLLVKIDEIHAAMLEKKGIYQTESKEKLEELHKNALNTRNEFTNWKNTEFAIIRNQLSKDLSGAQRNSSKQLRISLDFGDLVEDELLKLEQQQPTVKQVKEASRQIFSEIVDQTLFVAQKISDDYEENCQKAIEKASLELDESMPISNLGTTQTTADGISLKEINVKGKVTERGRTILGGIGLGGIASGMGMKVLVFVPGLQIPMIAIGVVSIVASIFMGKKADSDYQKTQGEKALNILRRNVSNGFSKLRNKIVGDAEESYIAVNEEILSRFNKAVEKKMEHLSSIVQACVQAENLTRKEAQIMVDEFDTSIKEIIDVHQKMKKLIDSAV